jgi:glyoxylase-like metal-dependent hydrolase (beta-lactamase superfamily II)
MSKVTIGKYAIEKVVELERSFAHAQIFFPDLTDDMLATCRRELPNQLTPEDFIKMSFHAYIVRTGRHTILVDTCCGNHKNRAARPGFDQLNTRFLCTLEAAGVTPEQVDFVMCTHLHWDHVGWNTKLLDGNWVPTFPNAKYIVGRTEYDHWDAAYRRGDPSVHVTSFEDSVLPIKRAEQIVIVDEDHEFEDGIVLEPCFGHSPGHFVINLASNGQRGVITGDVIHHQIQLRYPSMSTSADTDRDHARRTRTALIEKHAGTGTVLIPAHFQTPTIGTIEPAAEGFRFAPID